MKTIYLPAALMFLIEVSFAAQPRYFHFSEVILKDQGFTITAKLHAQENRLSEISIDSPDGTIELGETELMDVTSPFLDSITFALVPFEIDGDYQYFYVVAVLYGPSEDPGDQICTEEKGGETERWAPGRRFEVVFMGSEFTTHNIALDCDNT